MCELPAGFIPLTRTREDDRMKNRENLREKQVNLRLTQAEYERLTRTAQNHGIGRVVYLRMVLRGVWLREDTGKPE